MVHDVSHGVQIEAFIYSRLKGREICQRAVLAPPARSTIISLRALRSALERNWARQSIQGNTVHANFVISCSCLRNRGYVSNRDVPFSDLAPHSVPVVNYRWGAVFWCLQKWRWQQALNGLLHQRETHKTLTVHTVFTVTVVNRQVCLCRDPFHVIRHF